MNEKHSMNENGAVVPSTALFGIQFAEGQVRFDFWPDDLAKTVGRMAVIPSKSIYTENGVPDSIECGEIVSADRSWIKIKLGAGFIETSVDHAFLVPNAPRQDRREATYPARDCSPGGDA